mgnify:CR=1 FL=1
MLDAELSNNAKRFLKNADKELYDRIISNIEELQKEPLPKDATTVKGLKGKVYRIRVGSYRILYEIYREKSKLVVIKIDKRETVYD